MPISATTRSTSTVRPPDSSTRPGAIAITWARRSTRSHAGGRAASSFAPATMRVTLGQRVARDLDARAQVRRAHRPHDARRRRLGDDGREHGAARSRPSGRGPTSSTRVPASSARRRWSVAERADDVGPALAACTERERRRRARRVEHGVGVDVRSPPGVSARMRKPRSPRIGWPTSSPRHMPARDHRHDRVAQHGRRAPAAIGASTASASSGPVRIASPASASGVPARARSSRAARTTASAPQRMERRADAIGALEHGDVVATPDTTARRGEPDRPGANDDESVTSCAPSCSTCATSARSCRRRGSPPRR